MSTQYDGNIEQQVKDIYVALGKYEEEVASPLFEPPRFKHPQSKRVILFCLLIPIVLVVACSVLALFMGLSEEYVKLAFLFLLLVGYVVLPIIQLMELYADRAGIFQFFRNANKLVFEGLVQTIKEDCHLIRELKKQSIEALQLVKQRISSQQSAVEIRMGILVGALTKVGIVPGLITLVLAASKQDDIVTFILAIVVFVLYLFAFTVHFSLPRLGFYIELIQNEIKSRD